MRLEEITDRYGPIDPGPVANESRSLSIQLPPDNSRETQVFLGPGSYSTSQLFTRPLGDPEIWQGTIDDNSEKALSDVRSTLAEMSNAVFISEEEGLPLEVVTPLLPFYEQRYSNALLGEEFKSPVTFREKTGQLLLQEDLDRYAGTPSERVERTKAYLTLAMNQPGYGIAPPELSPDGLSIDERLKKIHRKNPRTPQLAPADEGQYLPPQFQDTESTDSLQRLHRLHQENIAQWRLSLITPDNITQRAIQQVNAEDRPIDSVIGNHNFRAWASEYYQVKVPPPGQSIDGKSPVTDPNIRRLAEEWLLSQPGSGDIIVDHLFRSAKGAVANTGGSVAGSIGVALTAAGMENAGQYFIDVADGTQVVARDLTDPRQDHLITANIAETAGGMAAFVIPGTLVARAGRLAGLGETSIALATTATTATVAATENSFRQYQLAIESGASQDDATLVAGLAALVGATGAIPAAQWALRLERSGPALQILYRMAVETTEATIQGSGQELANNVIAQQTYDKNRAALEGVADAAALNASAAIILSLLTSIAAHTKAKQPAIRYDDRNGPLVIDSAGATATNSPPPSPLNTDYELKFSKNKGAHKLALPRGVEYKTLDERLQDPAYVLEDILRERGHANESQRGKHGRELARGSSLFAWAAIHGRNLKPGIFTSYIAGGGEHSILRERESGRIIKLTKPGLFGAQAEDVGAYLERMALSNRVFGDDVKFEGIVTLPGEDAPRTVISQSFVKGRDATSEEQADYLRGKGFIEHEGRWVHPILNVAVWDTITPGNVITRPDGTMQAVDLQIEPARPQELREVREKSGQGGDTAFSRHLSSDAPKVISEQSALEIDSAIKRLQVEWPEGPKILAIFDENSLAKLYADDTLEAIRTIKPEALYDGSRQRVLLFPENFSLASASSLTQHVERKALHEVVGHHGLSALFKGELASEYNSIIRSAFAHFQNRSFGSNFERRHGYSTLTELADYYGFDLSTEKGKADVIEEHLARIAEDRLSADWHHRLISQITTLLRKLGLTVWTHADTLALIQRSHQSANQTRSGAEELRLGRDLTRLDTIADVIAAARQSENSKKFVQLGTISPSEAQNLPMPNGESLDGFRRMIDNFSVRHIETRHGIGSGDATPVTDQDIMSLPEILNAPGHSCLAGTTDTGRSGIMHARYLNGWYFIVEEVRLGNKVLAVTSIWKRRPLARFAEALAQTSETLQGTAKTLLNTEVENYKGKRSFRQK